MKKRRSRVVLRVNRGDFIDSFRIMKNREPTAQEIDDIIDHFTLENSDIAWEQIDSLIIDSINSLEEKKE
jgi:hypothetical protein